MTSLFFQFLRWIENSTIRDIFNSIVDFLENILGDTGFFLLFLFAELLIPIILLFILTYFIITFVIQKELKI